MSLEVHITFGIVPEMFRHNPEGLLREIAYPALREGTEFLAGRLAVNTPVGATGKARQGVIATVDTGLFGTIVGHVDYAEPASGYIAFADQGTRPHWPPYEPIAYWARRVLFTDDPKVVNAIRHAISVRGTKAQHFVEKTARANEGQAAEIVRGAAVRAAARVGIR